MNRILPLPEVYIGKDALQEVSKILNNLCVKKILIVTDEGVKNAGVYHKLEQVLNNTKCERVLYSEILPDPTFDQLYEVLKCAKENNVDAVIGIGGGSVLDTAKAVSGLLTNTNDVKSYIGVDLLCKPSLPILAIPTTSGTGSEVTPIAIFSDEDDQMKKGIVSTKIIPDFAFLDPLLTLNLPSKITASTGIDALTHGIESYTSLFADNYSDLFALEAIRLIAQYLPVAFDNGQDIIARENMQRASFYAGIAFSNAGAAAAHALAYPIGAQFHVAHGVTVGMLMAEVMSFNLNSKTDKFLNIARCFDPTTTDPFVSVVKFKELYKRLKLPTRLSEIGAKENDISDMAKKAFETKRLLKNNPQSMSVSDIEKIYKKIL